MRDALVILVVVYGVLAAVGLRSIGTVVEKAGYPATAALLALVPVVNFVALVVFATREWPIERALRQAGVEWPPRDDY